MTEGDLCKFILNFRKDMKELSKEMRGIRTILAQQTQLLMNIEKTVKMLGEMYQSDIESIKKIADRVMTLEAKQ